MPIEYSFSVRPDSAGVHKFLTVAMPDVVHVQHQVRARSVVDLLLEGKDAFFYWLRRWLWRCWWSVIGGGTTFIVPIPDTITGWVSVCCPSLRQVHGDVADWGRGGHIGGRDLDLKQLRP